MSGVGAVAAESVGAGIEREVVVAASALRPLLAAVAGRRDVVVAIDGPSGSGKSTFADRLVSAWPGRRARLVRLDEVYPGWRGLDAGIGELRRGVVAPLSARRSARYRPWDWSASARLATRSLHPGGPLVVEGCGAFEAAGRRRDVVRVWVEASDGLRKARALRRDRGAFDPYWDLWEGEWRRYRMRSGAPRDADIVVRVLPGPRIEGTRSG